MPIESDLPPNASALEIGNAKLRWDLKNNGGAGKGPAPRGVRMTTYQQNLQKIFKWKRK